VLWYYMDQDVENKYKSSLQFFILIDVVIQGETEIIQSDFQRLHVKNIIMYIVHTLYTLLSSNYVTRKVHACNYV